MTSSALLVGIIFLIVLGVGVLLPLLTQRGRAANAEEDGEANTTAGLEAQLTQIINSVRDLDFDYDTGKVSESDYQTQRKYLVGRGVSTLIRLDESRAHQNALDADIEALVARQRKAAVK